MSPETLNDPDKFKAALARIKSPTNDSVVVTINPRNTNPSTQSWVEVVKRELTRTNVIVANQIGSQLKCHGNV
jgi:hypothetical protein